MAILKSYTSDAAGKLEKKRDKIDRIINTQYLSLEGVLKNLMNEVWHDTDPDLSPAQIMAKYGTDAAQLFDLATKFVTFLMAVNPSYVPPETPAHTVNEDGSVTVG